MIHEGPEYPGEEYQECHVKAAEIQTAYFFRTALNSLRTLLHQQELLQPNRELILYLAQQCQPTRKSSNPS